MLNNKEIEPIIEELDSKNPLRNEKFEDYRSEFVEKIARLSSLEARKLETLLCAKGTYSEFKYNQGIAELMLYMLFHENGIDFHSEIKQNETNEKNTDVVLEHDGITYSFEVKSPEYAKTEGHILSGKLANRIGEKTETLKIENEIIEKISPAINEAGYEGIKCQKLEDNKLKDCLLSAQEKFTDPTATNCNILFICTTTSTMVDYWQYIMNPQTGFFNPRSDVSSFLDRNKNPLSHNNYNKVNAIILSNAITLNERRDGCSWDLNNSVNIVLTNCRASTNNLEALKKLSDFFPHSTQEYATQLIEWRKEWDKEWDEESPNMPELCFIWEFLNNKGFGQN